MKIKRPYCGSDWDEADKYVEMWNDEWRKRLEDKVYEVSSN